MYKRFVIAAALARAFRTLRLEGERRERERERQEMLLATVVRRMQVRGVRRGGFGFRF